MFWVYHLLSPDFLEGGDEYFWIGLPSSHAFGAVYFGIKLISFLLQGVNVLWSLLAP